MVVGAKLGFEERYLCVLGGSPAPPYIGGGGAPRGGESLPNSVSKWADGGRRELLPK